MTSPEYLHVHADDDDPPEAATTSLGQHRYSCDACREAIVTVGSATADQRNKNCDLLRKFPEVTAGAPEEPPPEWERTSALL